jgi:hypothetical protein
MCEMFKIPKEHSSSSGILLKIKDLESYKN